MDPSQIKHILDLPLEDIESCTLEEFTEGAERSNSSTMRQLLVKMKSQTPEDDNCKTNDNHLHFIAKFMPDESMWIPLNSKATFRKELNMYELMVPLYLQILSRLSPNEDHPIFPKYYGGRLNLDKSEDFVDENGVIVLQNLAFSGYENCHIRKLDDYHFKFVLEKLALFHSIGLIITKNKTNENKAFDNLLKTTKSFMFGEKDKNIKEYNANRRNNNMKIIKKFNYSKEINDKIENILIQSDEKTLPNIKTKYFTLLHNDLWINNIMFKYIKHENGDNFKSKVNDRIVTDVKHDSGEIRHKREHEEPMNDENIEKLEKKFNNEELNKKSKIYNEEMNTKDKYKGKTNDIKENLYKNQNKLENINQVHIEDIKFIDFQNTNYGSIAKDIIFLLYTSVDKHLWNNILYYIEFYYLFLIKYLINYYGYNILEDSKEEFINEFKTFVHHKLKHIFVLCHINSNSNEEYENELRNILDHCIKHKFI